MSVEGWNLSGTARIVEMMRDAISFIFLLIGWLLLDCLLLLLESWFDDFHRFGLAYIQALVSKIGTVICLLRY